MQDEDIAQYFEKAYSFMHDAIVGRGGKVPLLLHLYYSQA